MHQAAIAAALKGRKKRQADQDSLMTDLLDDFFESESAYSAAERHKRMGDHTQNKLGGSTHILDSNHNKSMKHEKQIDLLLGKVNERMSRSENYNSFASIFIFALLYVAAVMMQQDIASASAIQAAYQATIIAGLSDTGKISNIDEIFDWLQADIVDRGWDEPICGDGTCEWDGNEYPGFGRFGCIRDCGRYLFTTKITVDLQTLYNASAKMLNVQDPTLKNGWNLNNVNDRGRKPNFKWNIYSYTMGDFLLAEDALPEDGYDSTVSSSSAAVSATNPAAAPFTATITARVHAHARAY